MLCNQKTRTVAKLDKNKLDICGELSPCMAIIKMNILMKVNDNEAFFFFLLRWNFYPATNEFLCTLICDVNQCKILKKWCSVHAARTPVPWWIIIDSWKWGVRLGDLGSQCLLVGFLNLPHMPETQQKRHTKSLHEIIEIGSMWYLNSSRACGGHCLIHCTCILIKISKLPLDFVNRKCYCGQLYRIILSLTLSTVFDKPQYMHFWQSKHRILS